MSRRDIALGAWWFSVLIVGPPAALSCGAWLRRTLAARTRWIIGLGAAAVVGVLEWSRLTFVGRDADQAVLGLATVVVWLWIAAGPRAVRWSAPSGSIWFSASS